MCMIFDGFPSREDAEDFALKVRHRFKLGAKVYDSQADSDAVDPFPWELDPPIVLVDCHDDWEGVEPAVESLVKEFGGTFAGT